MTRPVESRTAMPVNLSPSSGTHRVEGENQLLQAVLGPPQTHHDMHVHPQTNI